MLRGEGWQVAQRSKNEALVPDTEIYLADTLGELGIWYALGEIVFLGGSLTEIGGHNPFEPAQFSDVVLFGPHVANFQATYDEMEELGAAIRVDDAASLRHEIDALRDPTALASRRAAAQDFSKARQSIRTHVADRLMPLIQDPA